MSQAAETLGIPVVSGNVSLYNETDGRPIPPTPVVGCVGLVPDVRRIPRGWRDGDAVLLAEAPAGLDGEAALVRFLWRSAPLLSLAHDVSAGGLEAALAQAALWSGLGAAVEAPQAALRGGAAVVACAPELVERLDGVPLHRLGTAGGDALLGRRLADLAAAWGAP